IPEADGNLSLSAPPGEAPSHFRVFQDGVELAPDDLPVQRAAREGVALHDLELDIVFDDGEVKRELISALPLLDANGEPRGAVASLMDITARRAAEKEREELLVRERELRAQGRRPTVRRTSSSPRSPTSCARRSPRSSAGRPC